ncbi:MAG: HPP family protein [Deltaproteobacteria bacterium]|nr:HPP family protein [Deltaproteobacteria bacterium]
MSYFVKMKGITQSPPAVGLSEVAWSWVGAFLGIAAVAYINDFVLAGTGLIIVVGSFGSSAVLIYGAVKSPLAQPRNLIGGHLISALIGVASYQMLATHLWLAAAIGVATSIALMHMTKTLHPPAGATALIAIIGDKKIHDLGYMYVIMPIGAGVLVMLLIALLVNNIPKTRRYPEYWF